MDKDFSIIPLLVGYLALIAIIWGCALIIFIRLLVLKRVVGERMRLTLFYIFLSLCGGWLFWSVGQSLPSDAPVGYVEPFMDQVILALSVGLFFGALFSIPYFLLMLIHTLKNKQK